MKNYALALGAVTLLAACSSEPSDLRPNQKVSVDAVRAGGRTTGLYPSDDRPDATPHAAAHGAGHGAAHGAHSTTEAHAADASEAAATGAEHQKSAVSDAPTEADAMPEPNAAADGGE